MLSRVQLFSVAILSFLTAALLILHPLAAEERGRFIRAGLPTLSPMGWVDFCYRNEAECTGGPLGAQVLEATAVNLSLIERTNLLVNKQIVPKADADHWNVVDRWDLPMDGYGDCEDYALLKRKLLMEAGVPRRALLMTIVRDQMDEGHAVLAVRTTRGDLILDNMTDEVKAWSRTPYRYVKQQSQEDPNVWVSIGPPVQTARVFVIPAPVSSERISQR